MIGAGLVSFNVFAAGGLIAPPLSPVGGNGTGTNFSSTQLSTLTNLINSIAPTNSGITASQAATQINDTNVNRIQPVVDAKLVVTNNYVKTNAGFSAKQTLINPTNTNPTITGDITATGDMHIITGGNQLQLDGDILLDAALPAETSLGNNKVLIENGDSNMGTLSDASGVLTNGNNGHVGYSAAITGTWIAAGTLPTTAASTGWMPVTNAIAGTNQPMTAGQALVVVGTNTYGATLVKGTNWPSGGGGSSFPLAADANFNQFAGTNVWSMQFRTNIGGIQGDIRITPDFSQSLPMLKVSADGDYLYAGMKMNTLRIEGNGTGGIFEGSTIWTNANGVYTSIQSNLLTTGVGVFNAGSSNYMGGTSTITNIWTSTNVAPTSVTIGVTAPDSWIQIRDLSGNLRWSPVWTNH